MGDSHQHIAGKHQHWRAQVEREEAQADQAHTNWSNPARVGFVVQPATHVGRHHIENYWEVNKMATWVVDRCRPRSMQKGFRKNILSIVICRIPLLAMALLNT
jgi:hypothetical protein